VNLMEGAIRLKSISEREQPSPFMLVFDVSPPFQPAVPIPSEEGLEGMPILIITGTWPVYSSTDSRPDDGA
jgi:hypothetical protein